MKVKIRFPIYLLAAFLVMSTVFADDTGIRQDTSVEFEE